MAHTVNKSYLLAAALSLLAAIIRTIEGRAGPLQAASESAMEETAVAFFHLTWHMVTIFFIAAARDLNWAAPEAAVVTGPSPRQLCPMAP